MDSGGGFDMAYVIHGRMTADMDGEFVVFLIGMRINKWWKLRSWLPVFLAMPRMLKELYQNPDSGFLGQTSTFGMMVQYWRSYEHLEAYANSRDKSHWPAWIAFNKSVANSIGDVGIWHETYCVKPGQWETMYGNMPIFGLGKASSVTPIGKDFYSSRQRLRAALSQEKIN